MRKSRILLPAVLTISLCFLPGWTASSARINSQAMIARLRLQARSIDAEFLDAEMEVPGFAGVYIDRVTRKPVVMLTDQQRRRRAKIEMPRILARRRHGADVIAFRQAAFPFSDLVDWKQKLSQDLTRDRALRYIGIDHEKNVVVVGVSGIMSVAARRAKLSRLRIPIEAVEFQSAGRIVPTTGHSRARVTSDLSWDIFSPNVSGEAIRHGQAHCTMGPIVKWGFPARTGFLSSGHCTDSYWGTGESPTEFITTHDAISIGVEWANPAPFTCPTYIADYHSDTVCRYSDAALMEFTSGQSANFGAIAHSTARGSLAAAGTMSVVDSEPTPLQYEYIASTGSTAGFTAGLVYLSNFDHRDSTSVHQYWTLGGTWVEGDTAAHGDSGGPVWTPATENYCYSNGCSPWPTAVHLVGLMQGQFTGTGHDGFYYSTVSNIVEEFGSLQFRNATSGDGGSLVASPLLAPYPVYASETHGYSLFATGGTLPFTCDWSIDYSVVGTGQTCTNWQWTNGSSDFHVSVVMHDAASHSTAGTVNVTIYTCNPPEDECVMEDYQTKQLYGAGLTSNPLIRRLLGFDAPGFGVLRVDARAIFSSSPRIWLLL